MQGDKKGGGETNVFLREKSQDFKVIVMILGT